MEPELRDKTFETAMKIVEKTDLSFLDKRYLKKIIQKQADSDIGGTLIEREFEKKMNPATGKLEYTYVKGTYRMTWEQGMNLLAELFKYCMVGYGIFSGMSTFVSMILQFMKILPFT